VISWLISIPVWGDDYFKTFRRVCVPSLLAAVKNLGPKHDVRFLIHTDQTTERVAEALPGQQLLVRPIPAKPTYVALQEGHADAIAFASPDERVVLLNADLVVSGNLLTRCAEHFEAGSQAVVLLGIRTTAGPDVPVNATPRDLLVWAWEHRHQIIRDLEWPRGGSMVPTNLFFMDDETGSIVARGFHLHPVAIVKHDEIRFKSTIDGDLLDCFPYDRIHVVTSPDDCAMLEVSSPDRRFPVRGTVLTPCNVAGAMHSRATTTHRWLFSHRIVVCGSGDNFLMDSDVVEDIMAALGDPGLIAEQSRQVTRTPRIIRGITSGGRRGSRPTLARSGQ
jgi:hypothetical protein